MTTATAPIGKITIRTGGDGSYRLNDDVFVVVQENVARLLDLGRGRFYGLDAIGTEMVTLVQEHGEDEVVRRIIAEYDVEEARVRADLAELVRDLQRKELLVGPELLRCGILQAALRAIGQTGQTVGSVLLWPFNVSSGLLGKNHSISSVIPLVSARRVVGRLLTWAWLSLRLRGWTRTVALCRREQATVLSIDSVSRRELIAAIDYIIREAASRKFLPPIACKERALASYHLLRNVLGLPATLVVGIQHYPFLAHAWVECEGQVLTDDRQHVETFFPVARYV